MPNEEKQLKAENDNNNDLPEFKPGDKPFVQFGNELFNDNVPWLDIFNELVEKTELTVANIAGRMEVSINQLKNLVNGNDCPLTFKQGAMLMSIYKNHKQ